MIKWFSITMIFIYSFSVLQINEYLKIPVLVEHFNEHQQENPKLSLLNFIMDHYAHGEVYDADYEKDMKLPFKSQDSSIYSYSVASFCPQIESFSFGYKTFLQDYKKPSFGYAFSFISNFHSSIWQPPKIC